MRARDWKTPEFARTGADVVICQTRADHTWIRYTHAKADPGVRLVFEISILLHQHHRVLSRHSRQASRYDTMV
jgi:hypothetical protein